MGEAGESGAGGIPGLLVNTRYRLVESIGQGGMGRVWRAVDEILDRLVAVKEIRIDGHDAEDIRTRRERTLREGRATARIDHPNVVRVYDVVDEGERLWIVMELVPGRSLERIMTEEGPLGPRETARIGLGLVAALRQVHAGGVLHRDIKPGNVLVESRAGRVVLTDFGIAAIQDAKALTMVGMLVGSPDYMAPERVSGRRQGPPSDLWSLGATLCAALSGHSPFARDTTLATLHAVLYEEPRLPTSAGPLHTVLTALLGKNPSTRPTLTEVETALRAVAYPPIPTHPFREPPTVGGGPAKSEAVGRVPDEGRAGPEAAPPGRPSPSTPTGESPVRAGGGPASLSSGGGPASLPSGGGHPPAPAPAGGGPVSASDGPAPVRSGTDPVGGGPVLAPVPAADAVAGRVGSRPEGPEGIGGGPVGPSGVSLARSRAVTERRAGVPFEAGGATEAPAGPHSRRTALFAVLGVVAVGVVVAVLLATSGAGGRREGARGGTATASSHAAVSPTVEETTRPHSPPPGARTEAGGFAWVPPRGWRRDVKTGAEVHYTSPDGRQELVGKSALARGDLLDTWRRSEKDAQRGRDYVKIRLGETSFQGHPAVVWEYTFTLRGTPWHARLLGFDADGKSYQINTWYQPEIEAQALKTYSTVKETFTVL
ncbi:protein kinase [Streptomyces sp. NPDC101151]|uniref:serine/threonine-protein kinase n=1 Tax=Streptomyces sp. NPDC101151 TaxID=3366115 RepID=UPI003826F733